MLERSPAAIAATVQTGNGVAVRRWLFAGVITATMAAMLALLVAALSVKPFGLLDWLLIVLFAATLPWTVIGFWNAAIGFLVLRLSRDPTALIVPAAATLRGDEPIFASTAVLLCIRNEPPARLIRNLEPMLAGLVRAGCGERFHVYVLSDTSDAAIAQDEATQFGALAAQWRERIGLTYRRRTHNSGFKAGNIGDFCARWGARHDFALTLDADSFMTTDAILRLVRIMQRDPRLGILQSLVVGLPSANAFTRIFQFGMRLGMRSYTAGSAWWQADCGPYWGHNALIRLEPFIAHCQLADLPNLKDSETILSHDQIEAVLMRRAGFDVRVLPEEHWSFEENPPNLIEFIRRDLRWCRGNLQYWRFLAMPGLKLVSRCQLAFAMLMFLGSPAWIGLLVFGAFEAADDRPMIDQTLGLILLAATLAMWFAPKYATALHILTQRKLRESFGGAARFLASLAIETLFTLLLAPVMWFGHTLLLMSLPFGKGVDWIGQMRDHYGVTAADAARAFWPHTLAGLAVLTLLIAKAPAAIPVALLIVGGLLLAIPLATVTASQRVGRRATEIGLGRIPEETSPPAALAMLHLPALELAASRSHAPAGAADAPACSPD